MFNFFLLFCSNLGYALIARVLAEKFANNDYEGWVQRNIFDQLGMTNTGFDLGRYLSDNVSVGVTREGYARGQNMLHAVLF